MLEYLREAITYAKFSFFKVVDEIFDRHAAARMGIDKVKHSRSLPVQYFTHFENSCINLYLLPPLRLARYVL